MEHSALHAIQLLGLVLTLGGPVLVLGLIWPVARQLDGPEHDDFRRALETSAGRWAWRGALLVIFGALVDLFFVEIAEVKGRTIFGGVDFAMGFRFATQTTVGQLALLRIGALVLAALATRLPGRAKWLLVALFSLAGIIFASLVSHAAAQPTGRGPAIVSQLLHIAAGAIWMGVLFHLLAAREKILAATDPAGLRLLAGIIRRFSPVALTASALLLISGAYGVYRYLGTPAAVPTSAYGLTFVVKLLMLVPLIFAAWMNYRVIQPALLRLATGRGSIPHPDTAPLLRRFGKMLELEVTAGVLVITVAGILGSVSPPGGEGALRLTGAQVTALLSPHLPTTAIKDPATFYGEVTRGVDDLRYAEFTHNWSGVMVTLMGLGWLIQAMGGRAGGIAGRCWPFLLVPFAIFIALAADPEVWILRQVSLWQTISDPQLLEHQLGAVLVLILVWLGWRDRNKPEETRPLGYALPVLMIFGSLLLLGHAHSPLTVTGELTNLINVQHAVFGMFGLCAGTLRWMQLRGLFPARATNLLWPAHVIALGLFMAFCYREVV